MPSYNCLFLIEFALAPSRAPRVPVPTGVGIRPKYIDRCLASLKALQLGLRVTLNDAHTSDIYPYSPSLRGPFFQYTTSTTCL